MPRPPAEAFQLCNWHRITRYAVREKEALRPTAKFPYVRLGKIGDGGSDQHGSVHETIAVIGQYQVSAGITRRPVGVARARHGAVVENKGSGAESPNGIRSITKITNHVGFLRVEFGGQAGCLARNLTRFDRLSRVDELHTTGLDELGNSVNVGAKLAKCAF